MADNRASLVTIETGGLLSMMVVVLAVLKFAGVIDWAWWVVCLPIWGPVAAMILIFTLGLAAAVLGIIVAAIGAAIANWWNWR